MKINNENRCKKCGEVYNIHVNRADSCGHAPHQPKY
jgi:ribosomal protein L37E